MKPNVDILVKAMIANLGKEEAIVLLTKSLKAAEANNSLILADEADFIINRANQMVLSRNQRKYSGKRDNRIKNTINFYKEALILANKL